MRSILRTMIITLLVVASITLFYTAEQVQSLKSELSNIEHSIEREGQAIKVITAEWHYLNRPDRLARLAERHLKMGPTTFRHRVSLRQVPERQSRTLAQMGAQMGAQTAAQNDNLSEEETITWAPTPSADYVSHAGQRSVSKTVRTVPATITPPRNPRYISVSLSDIWTEGNE